MVEGKGNFWSYKNTILLQQLRTYTEKEVLSFHGKGKGYIPKLQQALAEQELSFKTAIHQ